MNKEERTMKQLDINKTKHYLGTGVKAANFNVAHFGLTSPLIKGIEPNNITTLFDFDPIYKLVLYPLDYLTKPITHNGETFVPIEHFEIGDDDNYCYEFDNGNIKLIQNLKTIAKYNNWHDINFLPFAVVQQLIEWRFDMFNLINDGLAIPVTEDFNPYK